MKLEIDNRRKTGIFTNINGEVDSNTVIVGDLNTPFTSMERSFRKKINKETLALNGLNRYV